MKINPEGKYVQITCKIFDSAYATLLFIICCLPVITIGASTVSFHAVMMAIDEDRCSGVTGKFFCSFSKNFKLSTLMWLPALLIGALFFGDVYACISDSGNAAFIRSIMVGLTVGFGLLYLSVLCYLFAGIARYNVTWKQALHNSLFLARTKPSYTLMIILLNITALFCGYLGLFWAFPVVCGLYYLRAKLLNKVFGFHGTTGHQQDSILPDM